MSGQEWRLQAPCRDDPDAPFLTPLTGVRVFIDQVCSECPVKAECLAEDPAGDEWGVYGGLTQRERRQMGRSQRRKREQERARARRVGCGTPAGYARHLRSNEKACRACREAKADYSREWYRNKRRAA